jgi:hypothetical protein
MELIADQVAPRKTVAKESDKYPIYGRQDQRQYSTLRANGAQANQINAFAIESEGTYSCDEHALKDVVTDRDRDNADAPIDVEFDTTEGLTAAVLLGRERRVAALCTTYANFATSGNRITLSGTSQFNNAGYDAAVTADRTLSIESRISVGKEAIRTYTGVKPNTIVIPAAVAEVMKQDTKIREIIKYTDSSLLVNGDLPRTLWNMNVLIPGGIYDSANMGQSFTGADIWGKNIFMFYKSPTISPRSMSFGLTFEPRSRYVKKWRDEGVSGDYVEVSELLDEVILSEYCGYLIYSCIA